MPTLPPISRTRANQVRTSPIPSPADEDWVHTFIRNSIKRGNDTKTRPDKWTISMIQHKPVFKISKYGFDTRQAALEEALSRAKQERSSTYKELNYYLDSIQSQTKWIQDLTTLNPDWQVAIRKE